MLNLKVNMKYLVNFQIELTLKNGTKKRFRSTHTILENEIEKNLVDNFDMLRKWFIEYFHKNSLEEFIDDSKFSDEYTAEVKVGRITNSINGKYKTF